MQPKHINLIQLNVAVLIWGGTAMFAKGIALPASEITCLRSLVGAGAMLVFLLVTRGAFRIRQMRHYGLMAILGVMLCLHWVTYYHALKVSTAAVAILALHTYPIITALIEPFLFREKLHRTDLALAGIVFVGIVVMTPELSLSNATTQGIALGVVSGVFFMVRNLLTRKYVHHYSSSALMFWQMLVAGLVLMPWLGLNTASVDVRTAGLLVLLGVVFTAFPHTLYSASLKHLSAKTVGIIATLLPFYGAFLGYLIHHETLALRTIIGGLIILVCICFETLRSVKTS